MKNKLYILCGIPFSGKTTLAKKLVEKLGYIRIDLDEIKFKIFGNDIIDVDIDKLGWDNLFEEMYLQIKKELTKGNTVINDTGNFTKFERNMVKKIADNLGIETITIFVDTPRNEAYKRLVENRQTKARFDVADEDFESTIQEMESPGEDEKHLIYHSFEKLDDWININFINK